MKCSPCIYNFLEEITGLSYSVVFCYFFSLITVEGFFIPACYSLELCIQMNISFLFSFVFSIGLICPDAIRGQGQGLTLKYCYPFVRKLLTPVSSGISKGKLPSERWQRCWWLVQDKFQWREVNVQLLKGLSKCTYFDLLCRNLTMFIFRELKLLPTTT